MNPLIIEGKEKTPFFSLMPSGVMSFGGTSIPEDAATFYFPIIDWISDYYRLPKSETRVRVAFRYLNSSSASMVDKIFFLLGRLQDTGKTNITCEWLYEVEDQDMKDFIDHIQEIAPNIEFKVSGKSHLLEF